jgi:hypothetical protein
VQEGETKKEPGSVYDPSLVSRREDEQVAALRDLYEEHDGVGEQTALRRAVLLGQWGVPATVILFATVYWILGMAKYYSG